MRYRNTITGAALLAIATMSPAGAQAPSGPGVFGFYDAASGAFRPVTLQAMPAPQTSTGVQPAAQVSRSGRIRLTARIRVLSGSPSTSVPSCFLSMSHSGVLMNYSESQSFTGTRVNNKARCEFDIRYEWPRANNANPVNISISINISGRGHGESIPPIPLPNNGATVDLVVDVTA